MSEWKKVKKSVFKEFVRRTGAECRDYWPNGGGIPWDFDMYFIGDEEVAQQCTHTKKCFVKVQEPREE